MNLDLLLVIGLSHSLHPGLWAALLIPLRNQDTGGFILGMLSLPVGLISILRHNFWVWDIPVLVTLIGWLSAVKGVLYILFPKAHVRVIQSSENLSGSSINCRFRIAGFAMVILGAVMAYDAFYRR